MPRVSVIVPTFNCGRFLRRAIDSALSQTYTDHEVIVVDDGSTDDSRAVLAQYDGKIRYLYQTNRGASAARNLGLSKATGELIAYLDADDVWYPHKLATQVALLDAHPELGLVHSDVTLIDEAGAVIWHRANRELGWMPPRGQCAMDLLQRCCVHNVSVVERRECIDRVGTFDETIRVAHDYYHWIAVAMEGTAFGYIDEPLAMYRRRSDSLSSDQRRLSEDLQIVLEALLDHGAAGRRLGPEAADVVGQRLYRLGRELAYVDRIEGRRHAARRRVTQLIRRWPLRIELYADLVKACFSSGVAGSLRLLKDRLGIRAMWTLPRH